MSSGEGDLLFRLISIAFAAGLSAFALLHLGDAGGRIWFMYYGAGAGCMLILGFENRLSRFGTILGCILLMGGLAGSLTQAPSLYRLMASGSAGQLFSDSAAMSAYAAPARESLGLLATSAMLLLALFGRRHRSRMMSDQHTRATE